MPQTSQQKWNKWMSKTERIFKTQRVQIKIDVQKTHAEQKQKKAVLQDKMHLNAVQND